MANYNLLIYNRYGDFMTLILTVENSFGLSFSNRRLSRDEEISKDIITICKNKRLYSDEYSAELFIGENINIVKLYETNFKEEDYIFCEREIPENLKSPKKLILYKFNRDYPFDKSLEIDITKFKLIEQFDFKGKSHDKITRETYINE